MASVSEEKYTCTGPYTFIDAVKQDELVEFVVTRLPKDQRITLSADYFLIDSLDGDRITDGASQIKGTSNSFGEKVLIVFDKNKETLLLVVKFSNGATNKFEGQCY